MSVLDESRITVSLIPDRFVAEAARRRGLTADRADDARLSRVVLKDALREWWKIIPIWVRLDFTMQAQLQTQWCWAATSVSVSRFYQPGSTWTQCELVNEIRGQTTCCTDGSSAACNQPNVLTTPLEEVDCLDRWQGGSVDWSTITGEIDAGRPLAFRIGWNGGGGHFAVIEGYQRIGEQWVAVDDPWYGASDVAVSTLTGGSYQGSGTWSHTYFTERPAFRKVDEVLFKKLFKKDLLKERVVLQGGGR